MISDKPVRGEANGKEFVVKTIIFQPSYTGNWKVDFIDEKVEDPVEIMIEGQSFNMDLNKKPGKGVVISHPMEFGDGALQIRKTDNPEETTSWNSDNAWVLKITKWDVKPWNPEGDVFQVGGTASGKIAVCYKGSAGFANSWIAGTFTDAIVRYMGKPKWVK